MADFEAAAAASSPSAQNLFEQSPPAQSLNPSNVPSDLAPLRPSSIPSHSRQPSLSPFTSPSTTSSSSIPPSTAPSSLPSLSDSPSSTPSSSISPSNVPSASPSLSGFPSAIPSSSSSPSATPSSSSPPSGRPSSTPSASTLPSDSPSTTTSPSLTASSAPSSTPSTTGIIASETTFYLTQLLVNEYRGFTRTEQYFFEGALESVTRHIGDNLTRPLIKTSLTDFIQFKSNYTHENITEYILVVEYAMQWSSRYGYEAGEYPRYFLHYMNEHANDYLDDLYEVSFEDDFLFLEEVIVTVIDRKKTDDVNGRSSLNTNMTISPSHMFPSGMPSSMPFNATLQQQPEFEDLKPHALRNGFITGVLIALGVAVLSLVISLFIKFQGKHKNQEDMGSTCGSAPIDMVPPLSKLSSLESTPMSGLSGDSFQISNRDAHRNLSIVEAGTLKTSNTQQSRIEGSLMSDTGSPHIFASHMAQTGLIYPTIENESNESNIRRLSTATFEQRHMLMETRSESSSNALDGSLSSKASCEDGDEFDKYRNNLLEHLRMETESVVVGVESMLSLEIARVFMDTESAPLDISWAGGEDLGSIEASSYNDAFKFIRRHEPACVHYRQVRGSISGHCFFKDLLNKIVSIVHHGLIRPCDGARILYTCASIVGLPLLKEVPKTIVAVHGLINSNSLAQAHQLLMDAFLPFGDIVDASVAPQNRYFGFVRFVRPSSAKAVLEKHQMSEVVIQNVPVTCHVC